VTEALARTHADWWNHTVFATDAFPIGYWSRNAERFALYLQRRRAAWDSLITNEASWLPDDICQLYTRALDHLEQHWKCYLDPRFRRRAHLTLVHGDAYFANFLCPNNPADSVHLIDWQSPVVDIGGYDLANLIAAFWTSEQRSENQREQQILSHYHRVLQAHGVNDYSQEELHTDYQSGLIYWLLMPVQDRHGGSPKDYWWPKMQCLVTAFLEWRCDSLLGMA
jgi:thiamine kinase-like enzyme